ncbi:MAG: NAD-dependent dehydratase [Pseudonocardiales bacterium]|nr:NAD-dependent dehydratase [Pseudonocardiales bacterium]
MKELVAVTGAEGFIGSHLVEHLVGQGNSVRALVQYNSFSSWGWLETLPADVMADVEVVLGDVRDPGSVLGFMKDVDVVYHLAALIAIPYSYLAPSSYLATNAGGTLNVLEAARQLGTSRIVHTSTSEVYGTARVAPIPETHPLQAQSPYSASKIAADKLAESYHLSFETPVVTLRPFNTFGPRQSARAVISTIISQIAAGKREILLGSLDPTRDFTFVTDTARAFATLGIAPASDVVGRTFNSGSNREISVKDLVLTIADVMGRDVSVDLDPARVRPAGSEVMRLLADTTQLAQVTGWQPQVTLEAGLSKTAQWFGEPSNLARYKTDIYNV